MTGTYGENDTELSCVKGHWLVCLDDESRLFDLEKAMETAEHCPDYQDRLPAISSQP